MPNLRELKRRPYLVIQCKQKHVICLPFTSLRKSTSFNDACRDHGREPDTYYPVSPNQNGGIYTPITVPEYCIGYIDLLCPMTLGMDTIDWDKKMGRVSDDDLARVTEAHKRLLWGMGEVSNPPGISLVSAPVLAGHMLKGGNLQPDITPGVLQHDHESRTPEISQLSPPNSSRQQIAPLRNISEIDRSLHSAPGPRRGGGSGRRPSNHRTLYRPYDRDSRRGRQDYSSSRDRITRDSRNGSSRRDNDGRQMRNRQTSTGNSSYSTRHMSFNSGDPSRGI
ncbi:hypothetical protein HOY80DRAFT_885184 [Tuber brumale]|nr:hypothetical protein HOY80DRAFT_885184 [Tuber brumale]